jgi:hypothetical protein
VNAALRTFDAGCAGVEEGLVLKEIEVAPGELVRIVSLAVPSANGTGKDAAAREIQMDIETAGRLVKGAAVHQPWRLHSQSCLKQLVFVHARHHSPGVADVKQEEHYFELGLRPKPQDLSLFGQSGCPVLCLRERFPAVSSDCLAGRQGNAGMRPERRARSGVDGGLQVASAQLKPYTLPTPDGEEAFKGRQNRQVREITSETAVNLHIGRNDIYYELNETGRANAGGESSLARLQNVRRAVLQ